MPAKGQDGRRRAEHGKLAGEILRLVNDGKAGQARRLALCLGRGDLLPRIDRLEKNGGRR